MSCQVHVGQGALEGKVCQSIFGQTFYSFEGIPYAKPPVGKLRFRAPREAENWSGVRDATKPGNKCIQINPYGSHALEGSEDCLYLNVYTPKLPAEDLEKLPVLFFVHGGRLILGYGDYYRPDFLIRHNVILVTVNYRLHILGFLCLHTPEIPGNAGVKDTVMALKWVKNNIQVFNGDADNITVFGESAGAAMVTTYMLSDMANGLFNKVISQSGNSLADLFIVDEDDEGKGRHVADIMGESIKETGALSDFLTNAPIEDLVNAFVVAELSRPSHIINAYFLVVVEKVFDGVEGFLYENPHVSMRNNRFKKLPVLATLCSHEGALFLRNDDEGNIVYDDNFQHFIPRYLSVGLDTPRSRVFAEKLRKFYFDDREMTNDVKLEYLNMASDAYFNRDTVLFVDSISKSVDTYVCVFSFNGELNTSVMRKLGVDGASHGDLLQYVFVRRNKIDKYKGYERVVVDSLTEAWCSFAKTSKPSWESHQRIWPPYTPETRLCLHVGKEIKIEPYPHLDRILYWFDLMKDKSKL